MTSPYQTYPATFVPVTPNATSRPSSTPAPPRGTGAKRGRKPKAAGLSSTANSPRPPSQNPLPTTSTPTTLHWPSTQSQAGAGPSASPAAGAVGAGEQQADAQLGSETGGVISLPGVVASVPTVPEGAAGKMEEEADGEDEVLPAMADDDYSAQLSWQSQSKDNLKVLMDNFSPGQYDRFEAYRRHALPKQAVRKVIQQTLGQQVSQPVAQVVAGFAKVFVGEVIEKARAVQARRGETGPLSPDHLREAYRMYQQETGRVGAARPVRSKTLFKR